MKVIQIPIAELSLPERNVRIHSAAQIREYARSVEKFGQTKPIIVDEKNMILAGVGLYETLKSLGWEKAWCRVIKGLSGADKKKLMLSDNRVFELGITDNDSIDAILKELSGDFDIPGFEAEMLEMLNRSFQETDAVLSQYGQFASDEVAHLNNRAVTEHTEGRLQAAPAASDARGISGYTPASANTSEAVERAVNVPEGTEASDSGRKTDSGGFIICPKCGERIWL